MSPNLKLLFVAGLLCSTLVMSLKTSPASADQVYIKEVQGLLDSLPSNDPTRITLTLKLADAQFEEYLHVTSADSASTQLRHTILKNYKAALSGYNGTVPPVSGGLRDKVQFQMARLYNDDGATGQAEEIWRALIKQDAQPELKRESALRLGENAEQKNTAADLRAAEEFYKMALKLSTTQDVSSYAHYRLGWVYHRQDRAKEAVGELKQALYDSKGQIREEALRDFINFLAVVPGTGKEALVTVEELSAKIQRPSLIQDLADAMFAAGQRTAGVYVLESANKKTPQLKNFAHLLEEQYGNRNWEAFNFTLDETFNFVRAQKVPAQDLKDPDTEKIMRRLTVQLDGERNTQPARSADFKKAVLVYLAIYPNNNMRSHMIDGWLVAETDSDQKITQLKTWITEEKSAGHIAPEIALREKCASEAQKAHRLDVVVEQMAAIRKIDHNADKKREEEYQEAHAYYDLKDYDHALVLFRELAAIPSVDSTVVPDKWAVQSEHLALDILNQRKSYDELLSQAGSWVNHPKFDKWVQAAGKQADDIKDLKKISLQARFEQAMALGETSQALLIFKNFCQKGEFTPKSCENARVLSIKLRDEDTLISMLKIQNKPDELASEFEAAAHFKEAAGLLEPGLKAKNASNRDYLKISLLYELSGDLAGRDRVLKALTTRLASGAPMGAEEPLIYATLRDAQLLTAASLKFHWNKENRSQLISELEAAGHGTKETHQILLTSCENMGPAWVTVALQQLKDLDTKQRAVKFYGKQSKRKFEARLAALKKLTTQGDCYLQGADAKTRAIIATFLAKSHYDLADEIKNSPMPEGLDAEAQAQLKPALDQMAEPFVVKGKSFSDLAQAQMDKIENPQEVLALKQKLEMHGDITAADLLAVQPKQAADQKSADVAKAEAGQAPSAPSALPGNGQLAPANIHRDAAATTTGDTVTVAMNELHQNPNETHSLNALKSYYEDRGEKRLAAYFQGRLLQVETKSTEGDKK